MLCWQWIPEGPAREGVRELRNRTSIAFCDVEKCSCVDPCSRWHGGLTETVASKVPDFDLTKRHAPVISPRCLGI